MYIVTAKGLTKDYGSLRAVDNIDFHILEGKCFGFLGPNGAGKIVTIDTPSKLMDTHGSKNLEHVYLKLTGRSLAE